MKVHISDSAALHAILPASIVAYVYAQGWLRTGTYREYSGVFKDVSGRELIIPETTDLADYPNVVSDILRILSRVEGRGELEVYRDISVSGNDVIRFRSPEGQDDGSIRIDDGIAIFSEAKAMLEAAACAATGQRSVYRAGSIKDASQYMKRVKIGQTEQGSFIATLLAPVPPNLEMRQQMEMWPQYEDEPYDRKVTRKLAESLLQVAKLGDLKAGESTIKAVDISVAHGASANLYEALVGLIEAGGNIGISITWASTRPTPEKRCLIGFREESVELYKEAARVLRQREPYPDVKLLGFVTGLNRGPEVTEGRVTIKTIVDGKATSVFSRLDGEQYQTALRAHERQLSVSLIGDLTRRGERWAVEAPRDLYILEADE